MLNIKFINIEKIKNLKNYVIDKIASKKITGYASIDKPWDKFRLPFMKNPQIPNTTFCDFFSKRSKINSCDIAVKCHEKELSKDELDTKVLQYAKSFQQCGIKKGDIVTICLPPVIDPIIFFLALNQIGAIATLIHTASSETSIKEYLQKYKSKMFITTNKIANSMQKIINDTGVEKIMPLSSNDMFGPTDRMSEETKDYVSKNDAQIEIKDNVLLLNDFIEKGEDIKELNRVEIDKNAPAIILYTSGSTGNSKPIVLTNENLIAEMIYLKNTTMMQFGPKGVSLQTVSFGYPYGFVISTIFPMFVGKIVGLTPALTQSNSAFYINLYKPKYIQSMPPFYINLLKENLDLSCVEYAITGGAPMSTPIKEKVNEHFKNNGSKAIIRDGIGAGEVVACATTSVFSKYVIDSVGRPLVGTNVKVVSEETGEELKYGEVGILCFSGKNVMNGYYEMEEETENAKRVDSNGNQWIHTDTYAKIDEKGYVYVLGRKTRCFITYDQDGSAYKVYCDNVEKTINSIPSVQQCVVVDMEENGNTVPIAYVILKDNIIPDENALEQLKKYCYNSNLEKFSIPVDFKFIDKFPLLNSEKIDYNALKELSKKSKEM